MFANEESAAGRTQRPYSGGRSTVFGTRGTVACEQPSAALAGIRVLDEEGNAADACVAMAVLAPMQPGMGGVLLVYEAETGRVLSADGSGRAPQPSRSCATGDWLRCTTAGPLP